MLLGMNCDKFLDVRCGAAIRVLSCTACNTCYDVGGCSHEGMAPKMPLPRKGNVGEAIHKLAHSTLQLMTLVTSLLNFPDVPGKDRLVDLLAPEPPAGAKTQEWCLQEMEAGRLMGVHSLVGVVDNCSSPLPKCAHAAVSLLGLLVARRPARVLCLMDPEPTTKALHNYLIPVFERIKIAPCMVEERFGTVNLINAVPLLYHLGDWIEAMLLLPQSRLPEALATLSINLLHLIACEGGNPCDSAPDLEMFGELRGAIVQVSSLFGDGIELMRAHPSTFAMACLVEVQGRWQARGVPISTATCPCEPPPEVAAQLTPRQRANYTERVGDMWQEYLPQLDAVIAKHPRLEYLRPIAAALSSSAKPTLPPAGALLRGPLLACVSCALPGCELTAATDGGKLKVCSGGCYGLAQYCSTEHQKAHWNHHKAFCKRQTRQAETALNALQDVCARTGADNFQARSIQYALTKAVSKSKKSSHKARSVVTSTSSTDID
jgi:hypothetical protein